MNSHQTWNRSRPAVIVLLLLLASHGDGLIGTAAETEAQAFTAGKRPLPAVTATTVAGGGGLPLTVYEGGEPSGPPIVFIHGFTGSYLSWERQLVGPLAAEFRLVAYDLRGHGASDKPLDPSKYTDGTQWADDLDAVIRAKALDRPVLVGWSYGAYVISDYLRKHTDNAIGGVVFVGANTKNGTAEAASHLTDEVLALFGDVFSTDLLKSIDGTRALVRLFGNRVRDTSLERAYGTAMMVPPAVRAAMFNRLIDNDDVLGRIVVPTLVIHGDADRIVRVSGAIHTASTVPGAGLLVYGGAGHAVQFDAPQRFARDLSELVRSTRRSRPK
jgi:pimeloyl-ACP methyl ester carboxylesterase